MSVDTCLRDHGRKDTAHGPLTMDSGPWSLSEGNLSEGDLSEEKDGRKNLSDANSYSFF